MLAHQLSYQRFAAQTKSEGVPPSQSEQNIVEVVDVHGQTMLKRRAAFAAIPCCAIDRPAMTCQITKPCKSQLAQRCWHKVVARKRRQPDRPAPKQGLHPKCPSRALGLHEHRHTASRIHASRQQSVQAQKSRPVPSERSDRLAGGSLQCMHRKPQERSAMYGD